MSSAYHVILSTSDSDVHEFEFPAADAVDAVNLAYDQVKASLNGGVVTHAHVRPAVGFMF